MDNKRWHDGHWFFNLSLASWCYLKPGYYEAGGMPTSEDFLHQIPDREVESLIRELDTHGWIKPRLDERLRAEDLKITHRLLDIIQANSKQADGYGVKMKLCPIQELCPHYTNGSKRKVHHIRLTDSCKKWLDMSCGMGVSLQVFIKGPIACDIQKIKRIKGGLK